MEVGSRSNGYTSGVRVAIGAILDAIRTSRSSKSGFSCEKKKRNPAPYVDLWMPALRGYTRIDFLGMKMHFLSSWWEYGGRESF